jgi:hypothetical protein
MASEREEGLLQWQLALYPGNHRARSNLIVHALTVPWFWMGTLALLSAPRTGLVSAGAGLAAMVLAVFLQGRTHAREAVAPVPFRGPLDVVARIFVEQWITFPRFVLGGGFAAAWRASR